MPQLLLLLQDATPAVDWQAWLNLLLGPLGLTVGLILVMVAFVREWVVPGTRYRKDTDDLKAIVATLTAQVGDVAKATEERNRNEQARLDLLRGSSQGLSEALQDAEHQIGNRRRTRST